MVGRTVSEDQADVFDLDGFEMSELVEFGFDTPLRLTTAGRNVTAGGHLWKGDGTLRSISDLQEDLTLQAHGGRLVLSGADVALVSFAMRGLGKGKYVSIYVVPFDPVTGQAIDPPILESRTRIDTMNIRDGVDE